MSEKEKSYTFDFQIAGRYDRAARPGTLRAPLRNQTGGLVEKFSPPPRHLPREPRRWIRTRDGYFGAHCVDCSQPFVPPPASFLASGAVGMTTADGHSYARDDASESVLRAAGVMTSQVNLGRELTPRAATVLAGYGAGRFAMVAMGSASYGAGGPAAPPDARYVGRVRGVPAVMLPDGTVAVAPSRIYTPDMIGMTLDEIEARRLSIASAKPVSAGIWVINRPAEHTPAVRAEAPAPKCGCGSEGGRGPHSHYCDLYIAPPVCSAWTDADDDD